MKHLAPAVSAFLLSFAVILITWVNHHGTLRIVPRSSVAFMYANGFLLLTVVFIPFPTALLGEFIFHGEGAAPAVFLYNLVLALQAIGWILVSGSAISNQLAMDDKAIGTLREHRRSGYFAFVFYSLLAVVALWLPLLSAAVTALSWMFWLVLSLRGRAAA